ncbi:MAG: hypothetical protein ACTHZ9_11685 [Leucobacter sp.]
MSENAYVKQLVAEHPWVEWAVEFDSGSRPRVDLWAVVVDHEPDTQLHRQAVRWHRLFIVSLIATFALVIAAVTNDWDSGLVIVAALTIFTAISWIRAQLLRDTADVEVTEVKREASYQALVADYIDPVWEQAFQQGLDAQDLLVQWLLAACEDDEMEGRIERGERAKTKLSPTDPVRDTVHVEIETLRSRQDKIRADRQQQTAIIDGLAHHHLEAIRRERVAAEERRQFEGQLRAIGDDEQSQFEAHKQAQEWLNEDN